MLGLQLLQLSMSVCVFLHVAMSRLCRVSALYAYRVASRTFVRGCMTTTHRFACFQCCADLHNLLDQPRYFAPVSWAQIAQTRCFAACRLSCHGPQGDARIM